MNQEIAIIGMPALPVFAPALSAETIATKDSALAVSALIGKVTNRAENDAANNARKQLREVSSGLDKQRKRLTDPLIEIQRACIRAVEPHIDELKQEDARLESLVKEFTLAEQRRIREEQEAQEREIRRIEAERQAEIVRIAREQAAAEEKLRREREAAECIEREQREAAERLAAEAKNEAQREAAEAARKRAEAQAQTRRAEQERQQAELDARAAQQAREATERAADATRIESRAIEITRSVGQVVKKKWVIESINDFQLMKARPDLVRRVEWDKVALTEALESCGGKLPGVTAREDINVSVRGKAHRTIDV